MQIPFCQPWSGDGELEMLHAIACATGTVIDNAPR
jgi:hypothetical protein